MLGYREYVDACQRRQNISRVRANFKSRMAKSAALDSDQFFFGAPVL